MKMRRNRPVTVPIERNLKSRRRNRLVAKYAIFNVKEHVAELELDADFFRSITPNTTILELGAGTARLAEHILRKTSMRPENYEILDKNYGQSMPFIKKRIFLLIKKGKIRVTHADAFTHNYPKKHYDHILMPQSFFPPSLPRLHRVVSFETGMKALEADLKTLAGRLKPALKANGTIRISSMIIVNLAERLLEERNPFPGFHMKIKGEGLILRKR